MALINIGNGALAKSSVLNDNFIYLDEKIASTAQTLDAKIGLVSNNASTVTSNLANTQSTVNKINDDIASISTTLNELSENTVSKDLSDATIGKEFADKLLTMMMPNYRAGITISNGWTATSNGIVYFQGQVDGTSSITIDGVYFQVSYDTGDGQSNGNLSMLVGKGAVISGLNRIASARFYPCKGV